MLKSKPVPYEPYTPQPAPERVEAEEVLTADEIRQRIAAREAGIREHLAGLKGELTTLDDVTVAGRPVLGHVRARPLEAVGAAAAAGALVGVFAGLVRRWRREDESEEEQTLRLFTTALLEDASEHVARGSDTHEALKLAARRHAPVVYYAPYSKERGAVRQAFDLALKSALGFGVKAGMDLLSKKLTGTPEVFTATQEAAENPPAGAS